jgi:hypothetical protein
VNKTIEDFGHFLFWHRRVESDIHNLSSAANHPLAAIVHKRIEASEISAFGSVRTKDVWARYFPDKINNLPTQKYLMDQTFYRPRDLVRLLKICIEQNKRDFTITQQILEEARKRYSEQTWTELAEELRITYQQEDINALESLFTGFKPRFSLGEFQERIAGKSDSKIERLIEKHKPTELLEDLFRIGMVGNEYSVQAKHQHVYVNRWAFRDDAKLIPEKQMAIHRSLWKHFSLA